MAIVEHVLMVKVRGNSAGGGRTDAASAVQAIDSALRLNGFQCEITGPDDLSGMRDRIMEIAISAARVRDQLRAELDVERRREAWEQAQDELNDSTLPPYRPETASGF